MGIYLFMHKKKFNFVSWPTVDFNYMIKINKRSEEQLERILLIFEQIADPPAFLALAFKVLKTVVFEAQTFAPSRLRIRKNVAKFIALSDRLFILSYTKV